MHITVHWTSLLSNSEMPLVYGEQFQRQWDFQDWIRWKPTFWSLPKFSFSKWCLLSWALVLLIKINVQVSLFFVVIKEHCSHVYSHSIACMSFHFMSTHLKNIYLFYTHPECKNHNCKWLNIFQCLFFLWSKNHDVFNEYILKKLIFAFSWYFEMC